MIDILIACYNRKALLVKTLESIDKQTFKDYRVILVDDGSDEDMSDIAKLVDKYVKIEHDGISSARNETLKQATAEYIFVMDSDDRLDTRCLEKLDDFIKHHNADWVFPGFKLTNCDGVSVGSFETSPQTFKELYRCKKIPHGGSLIKRSTLKDVVYDDAFTSAVDLDFTLNYMLKNKDAKIMKLNEPLYIYIKHGDQETGTHNQLAQANLIRAKYKEYV